MAQVRPGCVPASVPPSPARPTMKGRGVPGGVCPATHVVHPAPPAGRLSAGWRSETWPGGFARAGQSRQPGTDRPGSSARALLPRPRVTPGGGHLRDPPTSASAVGIPVPRGLPARRQGGYRARPRRPTSESPGFAPHRPRPARGSPGSLGGCFGPRALHVVPDSERVLRAVLGDSRFAPSAPVQRPGVLPAFARAAGFRAITVRTGARRPLQGRTRRGRGAGR